MIHGPLSASFVRRLFAFVDRQPAPFRAAARSVLFAAAGSPHGMRTDDVFAALSVARGTVSGYWHTAHGVQAFKVAA